MEAVLACILGVFIGAGGAYWIVLAGLRLLGPGYICRVYSRSSPDVYTLHCPNCGKCTCELSAGKDGVTVVHQAGCPAAKV